MTNRNALFCPFKTQKSNSLITLSERVIIQKVMTNQIFYSRIYKQNAI